MITKKHTDTLFLTPSLWTISDDFSNVQWFVVQSFL